MIGVILVGVIIAVVVYLCTGVAMLAAKDQSTDPAEKHANLRIFTFATMARDALLFTYAGYLGARLAGGA